MKNKKKKIKINHLLNFSKNNMQIKKEINIMRWEKLKQKEKM